MAYATNPWTEIVDCSTIPLKARRLLPLARCLRSRLRPGSLTSYLGPVNGAAVTGDLTVRRISSPRVHLLFFPLCPLFCFLNLLLSAISALEPAAACLRNISPRADTSFFGMSTPFASSLRSPMFPPPSSSPSSSSAAVSSRLADFQRVNADGHERVGVCLASPTAFACDLREHASSTRHADSTRRERGREVFGNDIEGEKGRGVGVPRVAVKSDSLRPGFCAAASRSEFSRYLPQLALY